jgi:hypothetical protein
MVLEWGLIFLGLICLLIFIGLPVYFYIRYRNSKKAWESIKQNFGFEEKSSYRLNGSWNGETFTISYHPGSRHERASITISLNSSIEGIPTGTLRAERWWDKLGKASGLAREFQSLSNEFNESVYIASDDERFKKLIRDATFRNIVISLLESRYSQVWINQGYYSGDVEWKTKVYHGFWKQLISPLYLEEIFSSLIDLRDLLDKKRNLGSPVVRKSRESHQPSTLITGIGYGIPISSIIIGGILFFWGTYYPTFTSHLQLTGLKVAGIGLLVYLPIGYLCFRGSSNSHTEFFGFSLCAIIGLPLFMIGILTTANGFMDESSSVWRKGQPVELHYNEGDYYVTVRSIHNGIQGEPKIEIAKQMYDQLRVRNEVLIKVKDGFLSEPWVDELRLSR